MIEGSRAASHFTKCRWSTTPFLLSHFLSLIFNLKDAQVRIHRLCWFLARFLAHVSYFKGCGWSHRSHERRSHRNIPIPASRFVINGNSSFTWENVTLACRWQAGLSRSRLVQLSMSRRTCAPGRLIAALIASSMHPMGHAPLLQHISSGIFLLLVATFSYVHSRTVVFGGVRFLDKSQIRPNSSTIDLSQQCLKCARVI